MKIVKLLILFLVGFGFASCDDSDKVTISKKEYLQLKKDTLALKYPKRFTVANHEYDVFLGSDNHEYYEMQIGIGGYSYSQQYFHYPDCNLCEQRRFKKITLPL